MTNRKIYLKSDKKFTYRKTGRQDNYQKVCIKDVFNAKTAYIKDILKSKKNNLYFIKLSVKSYVYSYGKSKYINKVIIMIDWPSEWQTDNTSNVNILNIEIFFIT